MEKYTGETLKLIINMLRYISQKYFSAFNVNDNSLYWETNDEQQLSEAFRSYDILMDTVYDGLTYVPMKEGETLEEYFTRILK